MPDNDVYPESTAHLSKADMVLCSLRECKHEAAFDVFCGPNYFTTTHLAHACAFHRVEVMAKCADLFASVVWHDRD